jgi:hypothetical protein
MTRSRTVCHDVSGHVRKGKAATTARNLGGDGELRLATSSELNFIAFRFQLTLVAGIPPACSRRRPGRNG